MKNIPNRKEEGMFYLLETGQQDTGKGKGGSYSRKFCGMYIKSLVPMDAIGKHVELYDENVKCSSINHLKAISNKANHGTPFAYPR